MCFEVYPIFSPILKAGLILLNLITRDKTPVCLILQSKSGNRFVKHILELMCMQSRETDFKKKNA